jgi:hypothetical protein
VAAQPDVGTELDAAHERARRAYAERNVVAYMRTFHPALEYRQRDGQTIGCEQLASDVKAQLDRVSSASSTFRRTALVSNEDGASAIEEGEQSATYEVRAFGVLRRVWSVQRRGRYEWVRTAEGWQIRRVEILHELLTSRMSLAFGSAHPAA